MAAADPTDTSVSPETEDAPETEEPSGPVAGGGGAGDDPTPSTDPQADPAGPVDMPATPVDTGSDLSSARFVAGTTATTPGADAGTVADLSWFRAHWSGAVGFSGAFLQDGETRNGAWVADEDGTYSRVATDGDSIVGQPPNVLLSSVRSVVVASDGSAMGTVSYTGAASGDAFARLSEGEVTHVMRRGDQPPGLDDETLFGGNATIFALGGYNHSTEGSLLQTRIRIDVDGRSSPSFTRALWHVDVDGQLELLTLATGFSGFDYPETAEGCGVAVSRIATETNVLPDLRGGGFAFLGQLVGDGPSCSGDAIFAFDGDRIQTVERVGAPVPGTNDDVFRRLIIDPSSYNGHLVVQVDFSASANTAVRGRDSAKMLFERQPDDSFDLRLILADGETLPPNDTLTVGISNGPTFNLRNSRLSLAGEASVTLAYGDVNNFSIFNGFPHVGQPYPDLTNPGSSTLRFVTNESSAAPAGYPSTAFFSRLTTFQADVGGGSYFYGDLNDAAIGTSSNRIAAGVWHADADGLIEPSLMPGDELTIDGVRYRMPSYGAALDGLPGNLHVNDDGTLIAHVRLERLTEDGVEGRPFTAVVELPPHGSR